MSSVGVVREWSAEEGLGVVDSPDTPGGCWVHYSSVAVEGFKTLVPGQVVELEWEAPGQDGLDFRAVRVWPVGDRPYVEPVSSREMPSAAYGSALTVNFHQEDTHEW